MLTLIDYPICSYCSADIPDYLRNNPNIMTVTVTKERDHSFSYDDDLCFFGVQRYFNGASPKALNNTTRALYESWTIQNPSHFKEGYLDRLSDLEKHFKVDVDVFEYDKTSEPICIVPIRRSHYSQEGHLMRLLLHKTHFCFINSFKGVAHAFTFKCKNCSKIWEHEWNLKRHEKTCFGDKVTVVYPGHLYKTPNNTLEELRSYGKNRGGFCLSLPSNF